MITDRIILGTANFVQEYNGVKVKDVDSILDYAKSVGIWAIETAVATGLIAFVIPTIIKVVIVVTLMVIIGRVMRLPIGGKE